MTRRIAVLNQKGGVGKTTTTVNLAAALAAEGKRTLVLDLDPQAHATLHLGLMPGRSGPSLYEVLTQGMSLAEVRREVAPNLHIAGSHIDLAAAEVELIGTVGREVILRDQLDADDENYERVGRVLRGEPGERVEIFPMTPGTLMIFAGRNSVHRVSAVGGAIPRIVALLSYDTRPGTPHVMYDIKATMRR